MRRQPKKQTPSAGSNNALQVRVVGDLDEERAELERSVNRKESRHVVVGSTEKSRKPE